MNGLKAAHLRSVVRSRYCVHACPVFGAPKVSSA
jgi:hypothetical protein